MNLVDELDYVIGGYGKPNAEFIFSLNNFIESFILSSNFLISQRDIEHVQITKNILFPKGRPIFDLLLKTNKVSSISGLGNNITQCVYVDKVENSDYETAKKAIENFNSRDSKKILNNFIISDFTKKTTSVKTYSVGFTGKKEEFGGVNQIVIGETTNNPIEIVKSLYDNLDDTSLQVALPIFAYEEQIKTLNRKSFSKEIYTIAMEIQNEKIEDSKKFLGGELQIIPPLVSIVLSKTTSLDMLTEVICEIRDDFSNFRESCEQYEENLNNAKTIKEQINIINSYKEFWKSLVKKYGQENSKLIYRFLSIAKESDYEKSLDNTIDNISFEDTFKDFNIGKVAGKIGFLAFDRFREKRILNRFKGVTNLFSLIENSPAINQQIKDIERIFKTEFNRKKLSNAKLYLSKIKNNCK